MIEISENRTRIETLEPKTEMKTKSDTTRTCSKLRSTCRNKNQNQNKHRRWANSGSTQCSLTQTSKQLKAIEPEVN